MKELVKQWRCMIGETFLRWFVCVMPSREIPTYLLLAITQYAEETAVDMRAKRKVGE